MNLYPPNIESAAAMLTILFAVSSLFVAIILIFFPKCHDSAIKLLGSLMVIGLAFASNNDGVYAVGIFIIATLVTELDFLEKLAAIFWNREKYWEYRMKKASSSEIEAKRESEAEEESETRATETGLLAPEDLSVASTIDEITLQQPKEASPQFEKMVKEPEAPKNVLPTEETSMSSLAFERAVLRAIKLDKWPLMPGKINTEMKVVAKDGTEMVYDAIINTPEIDYILEIKNYKNPNSLYNVLSQLRGSVAYYENYLAERGIAKQIIPIAVVPSHLNAPSIFKDWLRVLKYDTSKQSFVNANDFKK